MTIACILCSAGWAVATVALLVLDAKSNIPRWATLALVFVAVVGVGACAVEDRVCEATEWWQR
jgi:hypothetical protein